MDSVVCVPRFPTDGPSSYASIKSLGFKLESESDLSASDMDESICSLQMELTASCQDTPDTETESSASVDTEFSIASVSNEPSLPEISSGPEDNYDATSLSVSLVKGKKCIKCHGSNTSPFLYCKRCYMDRKRFFPPRPSINKRRRVEKINSSISSKEVSSSNSTSDESSHKPTLCGCCMDAPCNGIFIHGDEGHLLFCYKCAHRIWLERKLCPYCNRSISKVVKLFRVDLE